MHRKQFKGILNNMQLFDSLIGLVAPHLCVGCGREGFVLCGTCMLLAAQKPFSRCLGCHTLTKNWRVCTSCRSWLPLQKATVVSEYEGVHELLVKELKFHLRRDSARVMAELMHYTGAFEGWVACPVPTAPARIRARGFGHMELVCENMSHMGVDVRKLLDRTTNERQLGSSRTARIKQMQNVFYVTPQSSIPKKVILVDDVMTTGSTLAAAAQVLRGAGVRHVAAVVFTQKIN